jgi:hypothetical protein
MRYRDGTIALNNAGAAAWLALLASPRKKVPPKRSHHGGGKNGRSSFSMVETIFTLHSPEAPDMTDIKERLALELRNRIDRSLCIRQSATVEQPRTGFFGAEAAPPEMPVSAIRARES